MQWKAINEDHHLRPVRQVPHKPTYEGRMPILESVEMRFMSDLSFEWTLLIGGDVRCLYLLFFSFVNVIRF